MHEIEIIKRFRGRIFFIVLLTLAFSLVGATPKTQAQPSAGDFLVTDNRTSVGESGLLFWVDPTTGIRTVLSDFGDTSQGPWGWNPDGVVIETSGTILVTDGYGGTKQRGALFRVDPATGTRAILSDFGNGTQGTLGFFPADVALEDSGAILVVDVTAGTDEKSALFRVDPTTGMRTLISDFGDANQGPLGLATWDLAIETFGTILVIDVAAGIDNRGILFRVDPMTGERTILSDFNNATQGPRGKDPWSVAIEASGTILVTDGGAGTSAGGGAMMGALFRIDPMTGTRTILSDFGDASQGPLGGYPYDFPSDIAVEVSGTILVADAEIETSENGALLRVDPVTGVRTIISDFGNISQGPLGVFPWGVAIYPGLPVTTTPSPIPLFSDALAMMPLGLVTGILVLGIRRRNQASN